MLTRAIRGQSFNQAPKLSLLLTNPNLVDFSSYYNYLIQENIPLIVMAGEFDMRDGV